MDKVMKKAFKTPKKKSGDGAEKIEEKDTGKPSIWSKIKTNWTKTKADFNKKA